jgi:hypothetical protein
LFSKASSITNNVTNLATATGFCGIIENCAERIN